MDDVGILNRISNYFRIGFCLCDIVLLNIIVKETEI